MIDYLYSRRVRNSLNRIGSPRQDLSFAQLKIYYEENGLTFNKNFAKTLNDGVNDGEADGVKDNKISKKQNKMLIEITKNNRVTQKELALLLNLSESTIQRHSRELQKNGLLVRVGSDKMGHWVVVK